jgi:hypothetical protein
MSQAGLYPARVGVVLIAVVSSLTGAFQEASNAKGAAPGDTDPVGKGSTANEEMTVDRLIPKPSSDITAMQSAVEEAEQHSVALSERLWQIAVDESRTPTDRRYSILLIGRLGTEQGIEPLVDSLDLKIASPTARSAEDWFEDCPCYLALKSTHCSPVPSIMTRLQKECSELSVALSALLIRGRLGEEAGTTLVRECLRSAETDLHRENLERVLKYIPKS